MARHRWAIGPSSGSAPTRELTQASGRRVTARTDAAWDAQFSIDGRSDELSGMGRLSYDLWCYLDTAQFFRGRIVVDQGVIGRNGHKVQFSATDYRGLLNRRIVGAAGASYTATDQALIAMGLITTSQALTGGSWGITSGVGASSGTTRDANYDPGKPIGDAIAELGRLDNGFEWEIDSLLKLNRYYPRRGADNHLVLDFGAILAEVSYGFSGDDFANAGLVTGDQTTTPVTFASATVATDPMGRWEKAQGFPSINTQATLNARGPWYLSQVSRVRPDYRVTFRKRVYDPARAAFIGGWPGIAGCWIGDTVYPQFKSGWIQEAGNAHRIVELQIVPDNEDGETVTAGLLRTPA